MNPNKGGFILHLEDIMLSMNRIGEYINNIDFKQLQTYMYKISKQLFSLSIPGF